MEMGHPALKPYIFQVIYVYIIVRTLHVGSKHLQHTAFLLILKQSGRNSKQLQSSLPVSKINGGMAIVQSEFTKI